MDRLGTRVQDEGANLASIAASAVRVYIDKYSM